MDKLFVADASGFGTMYLPPQGHLQACSGCLPAGHEMWEHCQKRKDMGFRPKIINKFIHIKYASDPL